MACAPCSVPVTVVRAGIGVTLTGLPTTEPFTKNVTVPDGGLPPLLVLMVALNVAPLAAPVTARMLVVDACVMVKLTGDEALAWKLESPWYIPVMECAPGDSLN